MGSPSNIAGSASQLFYRNKESAEFKALSAISSLPHPKRALLSTFVEDAADRETAAQFLLEKTGGHDGQTLSEFLADWIRLILKMRPVPCTSLDEVLKEDIRKREGGGCAISGDRNSDLVFGFILPPLVFEDAEMAETDQLYALLKAYVGESHLRMVRSILGHESASTVSSTEQVLMLSSTMFDYFKAGRVSLSPSSSKPRHGGMQCFVRQTEHISSTTVRIANHFIRFKQRIACDAQLPNKHLLEFHYRFAQASAWLDTSEIMKKPPKPPKVQIYSWYQWLLLPILEAILYLWLKTPARLRLTVYQYLTLMGIHIYGLNFQSHRVQRIPFNLYIRRESLDHAPKHHAEFQCLQLVKRYTKIPVPRPIDLVQNSEHSYLLMTRIPGEPIGISLAGLTDEQVSTAVQTLQEYITELRQIPNETRSGFQICNSLGAGIFDGRITISDYEDVKFKNEADFNDYLTEDIPMEAKRQVAKVHCKRHDIVFTHGDLNPRNILVDQTGKITGIVDWESAGWLPEYWEYSKAHNSVRRSIRWLADVIDRVFLDYREELWNENMLSDLTF